ncbi:MAG TPA: efflux RND transporter permease subunit [Vicinamibacterales bacterium]|nr:efflux RND transporter permease subunit [Vicinamibacterales bacterium]
MNISAPFIRRPVATTLIQLAIVIFGILGYRSLPVSDLPTVDFPTLQVEANLPGANPETMAAAVATPLEKQFATISGIASISSSNTLGSTSITLQFDLDRDIDAAAQDVQGAISRTSRSLPPDMPAPPSLRKVNPADFPILFLALSSPTLPLSEINEYAEINVAQRISTLKGVAQVGIFGAQKYAVRIDVDPRQLATREMDFDQLASAVGRGSVNRPTGTLYGPDRTFAVKSDGQLNTAAGFKTLVVAYRNGRPVRLEEVARVYDGVENDKTASWYNESRTIYLAVQRQPGTNTVQIVDDIRAQLPQIQAQLPASLLLAVRSDRSQSIRESVHDIKFTLVLTVALVVMVIFLFLRNISATIIPSLALPASIIGTFAAMSQLGFSLDNMSLMALTLSVGFVVDDAIVMLENIVRHMEHGEDAMTAALKGSKEIAFTIVSMTVSLAAVFIPVLFMGGIVGRLLNEFAVTIGVAILVSGFVSLTLTPMLAARFLHPPRAASHGRMYMAIERVFLASRDAYAWALRQAMTHHAVTMGISALLLVATIYCFRIIPTGFIPSQDTGQLQGQTEMAQGIGFESLTAHQQEIIRIIREDPNVLSVTSTIGGGGGGGGNATGGRVSIELKPREERTLSADEVIDVLRPKLAVVPGVRVFLQNPPVINIGSRQARAQYQFTLQTGDTDDLYESAPKLEASLKAIPGIVDVSSDLQLTNPQVNVTLDRPRMAALGLTADQVEGALFGAFGSRQVAQIYAPNNAYQVIMRVAPEFQRDASALSMLYLRTPDGRQVPVSSVTRVDTGVGPLSINHTGQLPSVTLSFNLQPGTPLGDAVGRVEDAARTELPATIVTSFQGTAQAFQDSTRGLGVILIMAIFVIYVVLGILYESFIHPLTILSGLPSAGLGALATLLVFGVDLNLYAFVGIIMLVGLVKKNGIMMIDFAIEAQRQENKAPAEAMYEACLVRFRPIMMTTMAALVGTLPIALGWGAGAESRRPLGLAVVGGLLVSQTLTLFITPVFYLYMEALGERLRGRRGAISVKFDHAGVTTNGRRRV